MNLLPIGQDSVLFINIFTVRPENQQALIDCMRGTAAAEMPGLLSVHLLRSRDGTKVINHTIWESEEAFRQATGGNPAIAATRRRVHELTEGAGPDIYDIVAVKDISDARK